MHTYDYGSRHHVYRRKPRRGRWLLGLLVLAALIGVVAFAATRPSSVRVTASPADARIVLEGVGEGSGTLSLAKAAPGRYTLVVSAPKYATDEREVVLERGKQTTVTVRLKRKK